MHRDPPDAETAEARYGEALGHRRPVRHARPLVARCHLGLGTVFRRTRELETASVNLTATLVFGEMGKRFWLEQAEAELRALA